MSRAIMHHQKLLIHHHSSVLESAIYMLNPTRCSYAKGNLSKKGYTSPDTDDSEAEEHPPTAEQQDGHGLDPDIWRPV